MSTETLVFCAESTLTLERFEAIRDRYWVLVDYVRDEPAAPSRWLFDPIRKPRPVPNRNMCWRRPTYAEAVARQRMYDTRPADFRRFVEGFRPKHHHSGGGRST